MENKNLSSEHVSVLADEIVKRLHFAKDGVIIDATLGHGGHSVLLGSQLGPDGLLLGLDVDKNCIARAQNFLSSLKCRVILVRENFENLKKVLNDEGIAGADLVLADLGFCSAQLNDPKRGLSFQQNMPLDMRLDSRRKKTAADIINNTEEKELADLIFKYGEERASRRIARSIVEDRSRRKITSTGQLASIICRALNRPMSGYSSKIHPATKVFQALRIAVNDELGCLERMLASGPEVLKQGGAIAVISFHSLEDRIVKNDFKRNSQSGVYEIITKKPVTASKEEMGSNIRARAPSYGLHEGYDIEQEKGVSGMTADAKVGLLLGLVFIIIIAFLINGLPNIIENEDGNGIVPMRAAPKEMLPIEYGAHQVVNYNSNPQKVKVRETEAPDIERIIKLPQNNTAGSEVPVKKITDAVDSQKAAAVSRTYTVKSGESLSSIAQKVYGAVMGNKLDVIESVAKVNGLESPDKILLGQKLVFPELSTLFEPVINKQPAKELKNPDPGIFERAKNLLSPKPKPEYLTYTIREDDSLWEIASEKLGKGSRYEEIVALNKSIKDKDDIKAGMKIKLPAK